MIMKKTFSVLGAFCLGAFITIGVMACAGDDNPEYNISIKSDLGAKIIEIKKEWNDGAYCDYDFIYDEAGRIVQIKYEDYHDAYDDDCGPLYDQASFDISYSNNVVSVKKTSTEESGAVTNITFADDIEEYSIDDINDCIVDVVLGEIEW